MEYFGISTETPHQNRTGAAEKIRGRLSGSRAWLVSLGHLMEADAEG